MQNSIKELLEYLDTARELETGLIRLKKLEEHTGWKIRQLEERTYPEFRAPSPSIEEKKYWPKNVAVISGGAIGLLFAYFAGWNSFVEAGNTFLFFLPAIFFSALGAGLGALVELVGESVLDDRRQKEIYAANKVAKEKWDARNEQEKKDDAEAVKYFRSSSAPIKELRVVYGQMLSEHYADGPIYRKYQTLPAVCQLYEYFDSGRFTELGAAYNQYELEVRLDRLIDNSEKALQMLQQISANQQLLYNALVDIRDSIDRIDRNIDRCVATLDRAAYAQEISAICLQQTALATTLFSQIEFYKNQHDLPLSLHVFEGALVGINAKLLTEARRAK